MSNNLPAIDISDDMGVCACGEASRRAFDNSASEYDSLVGQEELFMGLRLLRWWLLGKSEGRVLEVACGTARNIDYFRAAPDGATDPSQGVTSLTLVDASQGMLDEARRKARERSTSRGALAEVRVVKASAEALPLDDGEFDTVADTFGLCSMDDPVGALLEMQRVCKPGGKILLLEHGIGTWDFINGLLERSAPKHFDKWGCWYNRDVGAIVKASGLRVVSSSRWHFGTTYVYVCEPASKAELDVIKSGRGI